MLQQFCASHHRKLGWIFWALVVLSALLSASLCSESEEPLDERVRFKSQARAAHKITKADLETCSVYVLDVQSELGLYLPKCDLTKHFRSSGGILYGNHHQGLVELDLGFHFASQHAGPYWVKKILHEEGKIAESMDKADVVFVNDYCYNMAEISVAHGGHNPEWGEVNFAHLLDQIHTEITKLPRFQENGGADFAFFHSHPMNSVSNLRCDMLKKSLHINIEKESNYRCQDNTAKVSQLLVPYSSTEMITGLDDEQFKEIFVTLIGSCMNWGGDKDHLHGGMQIRHRLITGLQPIFDSLNMNVNLKCSGMNHEHVSHQAVRHIMQKSRFCLLPIGDTPSSRRLTEIVLSGCIPVFIAPQWHSMPLAEFIPYRDIGVFIYVKEFEVAFWPTAEGRFDKTQPIVDTLDPWASPSVPDADIQEVVIEAETVDDVATILINLSEREVSARAANVHAMRHLFMYRRHPILDLESEVPNVVDAIHHSLCIRRNRTRQQ